MPLTPKAYETLLKLLESKGRVLEKDALMKALWPDTFVEEGSLSQNVSLVRRALGESEGGETYIETIPRRGYRFAAAVREVPEEVADLVTDERPGPATAKPDASRSPPVFWWTAGVLALLVSLLGLWLVSRPHITQAPPALSSAALVPLTSDPGYEGEPTFSPDGETIAYVSDRTGNFEIFLKRVSGGPDLNITNDPADDVQPAFSPDGNQIAFVSSRPPSSELLFRAIDLPLMGGSIYVMPALGGNARRIVDSGNFPSWSPDGAKILYSTGPWFRQKIYEVSPYGGAPREIALRFKPGEIVPAHLLYPSYSFDGRWIAFEAAPNTVYVVRAPGGEPTKVAKGNRPAWSADAKWIIYSSAEVGHNNSLWRLPFSGDTGAVVGRPEPLTVGRGVDTQAAASRDGKRIAFTTLDKSFNLEVLSFDAEAGHVTGMPSPITTGNHVIYFHNFSPDGRSVVFDDRRGAASHIWRVDLGSTPVPLTSDARFDESYPRWSPDSVTIGFLRRAAGEPQTPTSLWRMSNDGSNLQSLTERAGMFGWLPQSRSIVYFSLADRQLFLRDPAVEGLRRLTNEPDVMQILAPSPDGEWVVYQSTMSGSVDLRAVSTRGGPSRAVVTTSHQNYHPFFSPSGRWLYFFRDHRSLYRIPGPAQGWRDVAAEKVIDFSGAGLLIEDPQISPDGRQLLYSRGRITADLWVMTRDARK